MGAARSLTCRTKKKRKNEKFGESRRIWEKEKLQGTFQEGEGKNGGQGYKKKFSTGRRIDALIGLAKKPQPASIRRYGYYRGRGSCLGQWGE